MSIFTFLSFVKQFECSFNDRKEMQGDIKNQLIFHTTLSFFSPSTFLLQASSHFSFAFFLNINRIIAHEFF